MSDYDDDYDQEYLDYEAKDGYGQYGSDVDESGGRHHEEGSHHQEPDDYCFTFVWLYLLAVCVRCLCPSMVLVFCSLIKGVRSVRCLSINYGFILEG